MKKTRLKATMFRPQGWENPRCNLCGSNEQDTVYDNLTYWEYPGKFCIVRCESCSLVFTSPRPSLDKIGKYYESDLYFGRDISSSNIDINDDGNREISYGPVYSEVLRYKKKGRILDIGAGTGMLLSKFKDIGWQVEGVELTEGAVNYAKQKYSIVLKKGDFLDQKFSQSMYDVIVLNGALEHLHRPLETLKKSCSILKDKGMIIISIPNEGSIGRRIYGRNWFPWQPPRHLYHFSPKTVTQMLEKAGFKNIVIKHSYHVQNYYILYQSMRYALSPKFRKTEAGGLENKEAAFKRSFSPVKELGKLFTSVFAFCISKIEPIIQKGEVMIVYATK